MEFGTGINLQFILVTLSMNNLLFNLISNFIFQIIKYEIYLYLLFFYKKLLVNKKFKGTDGD